MNGLITFLCILFSASLCPSAFGQKGNGWPEPVWPSPKAKNLASSRPAPRHDLSGMWGPAGGATAGTQAGGVQAMPNDGKPEHEAPFTPHGLEVYKSHKALEGYDAVPPGQQNDPRELCDPLGFPRMNHYQIRLTQIFQDPVKVVILYQYDNRWRIIWTDGRSLPKVSDNGVQIGNELKEQRFYGYSVGKWVDDTTLVVETDGTMPEDRVWLDSTGRPISDQAHVTETLHRVDYDTLEWSETINDPVMYTKPWATLDKFPMKLKDPRTDVMEYYCSPVEQQRYDKTLEESTSDSGK
jgi:hypothetical protein